MSDVEVLDGAVSVSGVEVFNEVQYGVALTTHDFEWWMLDVGCWMLGCWCWMLGVGRRGRRKSQLCGSIREYSVVSRV